MLFCNDVNWGGIVAGDDDIKWHNDGETAPLGGGDKGPDPTPITNPND